MWGTKPFKRGRQRDLMEREVGDAGTGAARARGNPVTSPDYRESPFDDVAISSLTIRMARMRRARLRGLERELAEELGLDPADISKTAEVKPRETIIKEAVDRADAVRAAINDLADIIPEEVTCPGVQRC
jgi:8-oxo-dGTP pyrophosphatase MutT (NUDIX family)